MSTPLALGAVGALAALAVSGRPGSRAVEGDPIGTFTRLLLQNDGRLVRLSEVDWPGVPSWLRDPNRRAWALYAELPMEVVKRLAVHRSGEGDPDAFRDGIINSGCRGREAREREAFLAFMDRRPPDVPVRLKVSIRETPHLFYQSTGQWIYGSRWDDPAPLPVWMHVTQFVRRGLGGRVRLDLQAMEP